VLIKIPKNVYLQDENLYKKFNEYVNKKIKATAAKIAQY
jgi:hypothetical protein